VKVTTIGKLDRRLTFQEDQGEVNQFNERKASWVDLFTTWGRMVARPGFYRTEADQSTQETAIVFQVRRQSRISLKLRLKCEGNFYRIISITEPVGFKRQLLDIKAELLPEVDE
jgi:SPP1 family predicted phage head-tail adaptor